MPFRSVMDQRDLAMLRVVFDEHCQKYGIVSADARNSVAASLVAYYQNGIFDPQELQQALDREERRPREGMALSGATVM